MKSKQTNKRHTRIPTGKQRKIKKALSLAFLKLGMILMLCVSEWTVSAQTASQADIAQADINTTVTIGEYEWYVVRKQTIGDENYAMLVAKYPIGFAQFCITQPPVSNVYEGSHLQDFIRTIYTDYMPDELKSIAVESTLSGNTTEPTTTMARNEASNIMFALSLDDAKDWRNTGFKFSAYKCDWWTRTKAESSNVYKIYSAGNTYSGAHVWTSLDVVPGIWVKCGSTSHTTYTLTYDGNGNTGGAAPDAVSCEAGQTITLAGPGSLTKTGYLFLGWARSATAVTVEFLPSSSFTLTGNTTLYAVWQLGTTCVGHILYYEDFGGNEKDDSSVASQGLPSISSGMSYSKTPGQGNYSLLKNAYPFYPSGWNNIGDHTNPNDITRGYFMLVDPKSNDADKVLCQTTINGLCDGMTLDFSAWFMDVNTHREGAFITCPKIELQMLKSNGNILKTSGTIEIKGNWQQIGFSFTLPAGETSVLFRIINKNNSTTGNDLGIDDIEIRFCVPSVATPLPDVIEACEGSPFALSGEYQGNGTFGETIHYRWERAKDINNPNWETVEGSQGIATTGKVNSAYTIHSLTSSDAGYYRLAVGGEFTVGKENCQTTSKVVQLKVNTPPTAGVINTFPSALCVGSDMTMTSTVSGGVWLSSAPSIAMVNPLTGKVTGMSAGTVAIGYAVTNNGCTGFADPISIEITDAGTISVPGQGCIGSILTMTSTVEGGTWSSSDPEIATIDEMGNVTGVSSGVVTIRYTLPNGCSASTMVRIDPAAVPIIWTPEANTDADNNDDKYNWHTPANWTPAEIPSICNDVYIPGNSSHYPNLTNPAACREIYFIQGAELGRPDLLTYEKAHVQLNFDLEQYSQEKNNQLQSGNVADRMRYSAAVSAAPLERERWYMLSSPLQGVVTGDLGFGGFPLTFLMKFGPITKENQIYPVGNWTTTYTSMIEPVTKNVTDGFAFYMYGYDKAGSAARNLGCTESGSFDDLNDKTYLKDGRSGNYGIKEVNGILELPFFADTDMLYAHRTQVYDQLSNKSTFYYINDGVSAPADFNKLTGKSEFITRKAENGNYRFAPEIRNGGQWAFRNTITHPIDGLNNGDEFLVGNPYLSSIDMVEFFKDNQSSVESEFKIWDGTNFISCSVVNAETEALISTDPTDLRYIAPFQGFFLKYKGEQEEVRFDVTKISTVRPATFESTLRSEEAGSEENILRIKAENDLAISYTVIGHKEQANSAYVQGEDVVKLFSPFNYVPSVYSLAGDVPVDINLIDSNREVIVPLGIKTEQTGEIRLTFTGMNQYFKASKIELTDALENRTIDLTKKSSFQYVFNHTKIGIQNGRFSIRFRNLTTALPDAIPSDNLKVYGDTKGIYVVSSASDPVQQVVVYDLQGRKMHESTENAKYYPLPENLGRLPLIVKVATQNRTKTVKLNRNE
ncbi:MAG: InlB B-repeat-containing protein [Candidatus Azobacteroides sp.]|nr:InlB B-repeat-containing protein [Candidatus Azobacteroides sp.]